MTSRKYFYVLSGLLTLVIALIFASAVGGNLLLQKQAKKLSALKVENETVERQQTALVQAKRDTERYKELDEITKAIVPQDKDQAKTIREIVKIAEESGVPVKSVSFQSSTLGGTSAKSSSSTSSKPNDAPSLSQVKPVEGITGVYTLEIQVESDGNVSYQNFLRFLEGLEKNRRTAHVTGINLEPSDNGNTLSFNLTLNAYLKPETP